ncbi:hypothetical protein Tco_1038195 [Tanacetum coccineum]
MKPRRARAISMTIHSSLKARILEAQSEASKGANTSAEMLKGLDKQFERKEDGGLYVEERIWVPVYVSHPEVFGNFKLLFYPLTFWFLLDFFTFDLVAVISNRTPRHYRSHLYHIIYITPSPTSTRTTLAPTSSRTTISATSSPSLIDEHHLTTISISSPFFRPTSSRRRLSNTTPPRPSTDPSSSSPNYRHHLTSPITIVTTATRLSH